VVHYPRDIGTRDLNVCDPDSRDVTSRARGRAPEIVPRASPFPGPSGIRWSMCLGNSRGIRHVRPARSSIVLP
jgi:hypothetical protein